MAQFTSIVRETDCEIKVEKKYTILWIPSFSIWCNHHESTSFTAGGIMGGITIRLKRKKRKKSWRWAYRGVFRRPKRNQYYDSYKLIILREVRSVWWDTFQILAHELKCMCSPARTRTSPCMWNLKDRRLSMFYHKNEYNIKEMMNQICKINYTLAQHLARWVVVIRFMSTVVNQPSTAYIMLHAYPHFYQERE